MTISDISNSSRCTIWCSRMYDDGTMLVYGNRTVRWHTSKVLKTVHIVQYSE